MMKDGAKCNLQFLIITTLNADIFKTVPENQRPAWSNQPVENLLSLREIRSLLRKRFKIIRLTTIIPTHGSRIRYRLINSYLLKSFLDKLYLG